MVFKDITITSNPIRDIKMPDENPDGYLSKGFNIKKPYDVVRGQIDNVNYSEDKGLVVRLTLICSYVPLEPRDSPILTGKKLFLDDAVVLSRIVRDFRISKSEELEEKLEGMDIMAILQKERGIVGFMKSSREGKVGI